jgi:hypothetical protein
MDTATFETHRKQLVLRMADANNTEMDVICNFLPFSDAARFKRKGSSTVLVGHLRELMTCGTKIKGCSLALPSLA